MRRHRQSRSGHCGRISAGTGPWILRSLHPAVVSCVSPLGGDGSFNRTRPAGPAPLRIHDLRDTAVSLWIAAGAPANEIAARPGHSSLSRHAEAPVGQNGGTRHSNSAS